MTQQVAARMSGFIKAVADQHHPLQTKLSLILTDFEPNRNMQAVPESEAENILRTALLAPIKINFDGAEYFGHKGAVPIGPISNVYMAEDNSRKIIAGDAIIWNDVYGDVAEHLKLAFAEGVGTSWEIYFDPDKTSKDENNIEWLGGCVFAGTCVVETPAYGPNRTRLLAIAEKLYERAEDIQEKINMASTGTGTIATAVATDTTLTNDISGAMDMFSKLYEGLWGMLDEADQLERELATTDITTVAEQLSKTLAGIQKRFDALKEKAAKAETAEAELTTLKDSIAAAEAEKAEAEKLTTRKTALAELGIELTDEKKEFYLNMADDMFKQYVDDLKSVKGNNTQAEVKTPIIPEATHSSASTNISIQELAAIIRGAK